MTTRVVARVYTLFAFVLLNALILLLVLNAVLYVGFGIHDSATRRDRDWPWLEAHNRAVYPGWTDDEIERITEEMRQVYVFEPYTLFRDRPRSGEFLNVSEHGFRLSRAQAPWPPDPERFNVFLFGGSTTFGWGVPDDETIASHLQRELGTRFDSRVAIYNFGRTNYQSTQERILFQQLIAAGDRPALAIFVDGVNDAWFMDGAPAFVREFSALVQGRYPSPFSRLPIYRGAMIMRGWLADSGGGAAESAPDREEDSRRRAHAVISRYLENRRMIRTIAREYDIETLFVWQPVPNYRYDEAYHPYSVVSRWRLANYPSVYSEFEARLGSGNSASTAGDADFIWCASIQEGVQEPLYVDPVHYSAKMSAMLARCIADGAIEAGFGDGRAHLR